jgi:hypothetical protein
MVATTADAEGILLSLSSALFPAGPPDRDHLEASSASWSTRV